MRVCIITPNFWPSIGGVETYTADLAEYLAHVGCQISVITWTHTGRAGRTYPFKVYRQPNWLTILRVVHSADVVQFNALNPAHCLLAKLLRKRTVWAHFDYPTLCPKGVGWWKGTSCSFAWQRCVAHLRLENRNLRVLRMITAYWLRRVCAYLVDRNVTASAHGTTRIAAPRNTYIPLGVHVPPEAQVPRQAAKPAHFLFWGRHVPEKGGDVFIRAIGILKEQGIAARGTLCGSGPETAQWQQLAAALGVHDVVEFPGYTLDEELRRRLSTCTAVVVPSLNDEYVGLVALEAMSRCKSVIASATGGLGEIVHRAGLVFEPGNAVDLAAKMVAVLSNPALREQLEQEARRAVEEKYSTERMGLHYLALYRELVAPHRRNA